MPLVRNVRFPTERRRRRSREGSLALGLDFREKDRKAHHPAAADAEALTAAGFGAWLDAQISTPDDAIGEPPPALRDYLRARDAAVWSIVAALEKDPPIWEPESPEIEEGTEVVSRLLPTIRLEKLLIATALFEEREGEGVLASRALEASWSLGRALADGPAVIDQILALAVEKWEAGALRKFRDPELSWNGRLSSDEIWDRMLDAILADYSHGSDALDPWAEMARKALGAVVDAARRSSRCDVLALTDEEIWRPADDALAAESSEERRQIRDLMKEMSSPGVSNEIRRAARVSLDREMTLRILELRLARASSPDRAWPDALVNSYSAVCPGLSYEYHADKGGMSLRFLGPAPAPEMGVVLPLEFHSRDKPSSPTRAPAPTPIP